MNLACHSEARATDLKHLQFPVSILRTHKCSGGSMTMMLSRYIVHGVNAMASESQRAEGPSSGTPVATPSVHSSHTSTHRHEVSEGQRCGRGRTRSVLSGLLVVLRGVATPYGWQLWDYYQ